MPDEPTRGTTVRLSLGSGPARRAPVERPVHPVTVDGFRMGEHPGTVAAFRRFVEATGYVTVAERAPDPAEYPGVDAALRVPGSLVFRKPTG